MFDSSSNNLPAVVIELQESLAQLKQNRESAEQNIKNLSLLKHIQKYT